MNWKRVAVVGLLWAFAGFVLIWMQVGVDSETQFSFASAPWGMTGLFVFLVPGVFLALGAWFWDVTR